MAHYVDGFVIPIPTRSLPAYRLMAKLACKVWLEHGALDYRECVGDDLNIKQVTMTFPKLTKAKRNETVIFAWIVYKSRAHRDRVNARVMKDPRMAEMMESDDMPFDPARISYGGFKTIVEA